MLNKDWNTPQREGEKDSTKNREATPSSQKLVTSARGTSSSSNSICHYHSSDAEPDEDADLISWTDDIDAKFAFFLKNKIPCRSVTNFILQSIPY